MIYKELDGYSDFVQNSTEDDLWIWDYYNNVKKFYQERIGEKIVKYVKIYRLTHDSGENAGLNVMFDDFVPPELYKKAEELADDLEVYLNSLSGFEEDNES